MGQMPFIPRQMCYTRAKTVYAPDKEDGDMRTAKQVERWKFNFIFF